ncbi:SAMD9-like protein, partial [Mya arenaria]
MAWYGPFMAMKQLFQPTMAESQGHSSMKEHDDISTKFEQLEIESLDRMTQTGYAVIKHVDDELEVRKKEWTDTQQPNTGSKTVIKNCNSVVIGETNIIVQNQDNTVKNRGNRTHHVDKSVITVDSSNECASGINPESMQPQADVEEWTVVKPQRSRKTSTKPDSEKSSQSIPNDEADLFISTFLQQPFADFDQNIFENIISTGEDDRTIFVKSLSTYEAKPFSFCVDVISLWNTPMNGPSHIVVGIDTDSTLLGLHKQEITSAKSFDKDKKSKEILVEAKETENEDELSDFWKEVNGFKKENGTKWCFLRGRKDIKESRTDLKNGETEDSNFWYKKSFDISIGDLCVQIVDKMQIDETKNGFSLELPCASDSGKCHTCVIPEEKAAWLAENLDVLYLNAPFGRRIPDDKSLDEELALFRKGGTISWPAMYNVNFKKAVIERDVQSELKKQVQAHLCTKPSDVRLFHSPGAGGTTLARELVWEMHYDYPCVQLRNRIVMNDDDSLETRLQYLHEQTGLPLLLLVDSDGLSDDIYLKQLNDTVTLYVRRAHPSKLDGERTKKKVKLSRLLEDIPAKPPLFTQRKELLNTLKTSFPKSPSFHAHLGRFYVHCRHDEEQEAEKYFREAERLCEEQIKACESNSTQDRDRMRLEASQVYHMFGVMKKISVLRRKTKVSDKKLNEIIPCAKEASELFEKSRINTPASHIYTYAFTDDIEVRLLVCEVIKTFLGRLSQNTLLLCDRRLKIAAMTARNGKRDIFDYLDAETNGNKIVELVDMYEQNFREMFRSGLQEEEKM